MRLKIGTPGTTSYSAEFKGTERNYHMTARFDLSDGYVGISQRDSDGRLERVLLSPSQVRELIRFVSVKHATR